jgi:hypothetical protein
MMSELALLSQVVERAFPEAGDRTQASVADQQGLGSSPRPSAADPPDG